MRLLELELSGHKDATARARSAFRMGEVYENRLHDNGRALKAYQTALTAVPGYKPALEGKLRLLSQQKSHKALVSELSELAATEDDPHEAIAYLLREAEVWRDDLREPRRALQCYESVLERDPNHLGALLAVEPLYLEMGNWEALSEVYATQSRVLADDGARVAAMRELIRLQEHRSVGGEAQETYIGILSVEPTDTYALANLERTALETNNVDLLGQVDARLATAETDAPLVAAHHTRLAELLEVQGDPTALDRFRSALASDGENLAAARGLSRMAEATDDPALLKEAAECEARVTGDVRRAAELLVRSADLRGSRLQDPAGALTDLERALAIDPDHERAAEQCRDLLLAAGEIGRAFDALSQAAARAKREDRQIGLRLDVADILADHQGEISGAQGLLHRVLRDEPHNVRAMMKLGELHERKEEWKDAAERYEVVIGLRPGPDVLVKAHLRHAIVLADKLKTQAPAVASLDAVLQLEPNNVEALSRLLAVQTEHQQFAKAAETAARLVQLASNSSAKAEALVRLARLERARNDDLAAATAYEQATALLGLHGAAAREFRDLLLNQKLNGQTPRWEGYVGALSSYIEASLEPTREHAVIYLELARILAEEMDMLERALTTLQRGLGISPDDSELRAEFAQRLRQAGKYQDAIDELRKLIQFDIETVKYWRDISDNLRRMNRPYDADSALAEITKRRPSLVFLDIWMQGSRLDGLQLLDEFQSHHPDMPVVMISGHGNVETAVSAIKRGAS